MTQILNVVGWYLLLAVLGWLAVPIAFRFLPALADKGYAFARVIGLLLWAFVFWILSSFGMLANDRGGLLTALVLVAALSLWAWRSNAAADLGAWLRKNRSSVVATEIVFALAFLFMLWIRATGPEINHTEQPMELAFINAILHSPSMPPHDPWLSGFSISYYYFGYLMVAMLAKLLGVAGPVAFNLGFVMIFAMAATAAYGLVSNLLSLYQPQLKRRVHWLAGLAPLLVLLMGNTEGLFEILHAQHLFWSADTTGTQTSSFWDWIDIKDLVNPPNGPARLVPRNYGDGSWWWWRASRVINDRTFSGGEQELIDEFPAFSFVLGDLHPHVLSMPFVFLAIGLALNLYLGGADHKQPLPLFKLQIDPQFLVFSALSVGALAFINIWDLPIYVVLLSSAYGLRRAQRLGWTWSRLEDLISLAFVLGLGGFVLFLPFFLGFTSQAAGIMPNLLNPSRGTHIWIMFTTLLIPIFIYLVFLWSRRKQKPLLKSLLLGFGFVAALWLASLGLAWVYARFLIGTPLGDAVLSGLGAPNAAALFNESIRRRLSAAGGWISLAGLLALIGGLIFRSTDHAEKGETSSAVQARSFVLLLAFVAILLVTAPEFIYLRDQFGTRMNTVFKFYIQAWLMLGVAASFAIVVLLRELRGFTRSAVTVAIVLVAATGFVYPVFAFSDISRRAEGQALTLDGSAYLAQDVRDAIAWLQAATPGTLVEAVGGSYTGFARYATFAGQPGVMGWPGHEGQWRGGNVDFARIEDIQALYSTQSWDIAKAVLDQYDIRYVIVGDLERNAYAVIETKFQEHLSLAFQSGQVSIYTVP